MLINGTNIFPKGERNKTKSVLIERKKEERLLSSRGLYLYLIIFLILYTCVIFVGWSGEWQGKTNPCCQWSRQTLHCPGVGKAQAGLRLERPH